MNDPDEGIVEASFVRKEFYLEPPEKGASPEAWKLWLEADRQAAIAAKRAFTKAQKHGELPETARPTRMTKIGGVWRQTALVGLTGDAETDSLALEPGIEADQERKMILARQEAEAKARGTRSKARAKRQREAARKARARRFGKIN